MTAWKETTFSDLGQCIRGVSYKPHNLREASGTKTVTLLRSNNIRDGRLNFHDIQYVEAHMVRPEQHLKHSDIAVCMSNGNRALVGKTGQFDEASINTAYTVGAFCSIFRPTADYESDFVRYQFSSPLYQQQLDSLLAGSAINNLKGSDVAALKALVPTCRHEQAKIAEVLSTVDRAIEETEALIAKQQRIKAGLMQDLLTRGIDEHGNLRSEQTHEFKDSPLGRIPVEWESASLAVFVPSAEYGISTSLGESGYPVLRMNNLLDGEAELSDLKFTDAPVPEHLWLRDGDVLFNRTNSWEHVGRTGIWRGQIESATFASYLVRLNPHPDKLLPEMLNFWLNWERIQIAMRRQATPAVQQVNINPTNLRSIPAAFPRNLDEQTAITVRLSVVREVFNAYREHLHKLKSIKAGLMKDLLTGDRRVTALLEQRKEVTT